MTNNKGCTPILGALSQINMQNGFYYMVFGFYYDFWPVNGGFCTLLGNIRLFLSPDFGRKLGKDNQIEIYKNQACLRP